MITETARVVAVEGEFAWVETQRRTACGNCAVRKGCGSGVLARAVGNRLTHLRVLNVIGAGVGDEVVIGIEDGALVRLSFAVYTMPLVLMIAAALAGEMLVGALHGSNVEGATVISGLGGLLGGLAWLRRYSRSVSRDAHYQPQLLRFADPPADRIVRMTAMRHPPVGRG